MKVSIVTATYNAFPEIIKLAESIIKLKESEWEWVISDGGSTDGTVKYIKSIGNEKIKLKVEKDDGIYDALNKGIRRSVGEYIIFMGADDVFSSENVFSDVFCDDINKASPDLIMGNVIDGRGKYFSSALSFKIYIVNTVHHQGCFYNKKLFDNFEYNKECCVAADYDLNLQCYIYNRSYVKVNLMIAECGLDGVSNSGNELNNFKEMHDIRIKYMPVILSKLFGAICLANYFYKKLKMNLTKSRR